MALFTPFLGILILLPASALRLQPNESSDSPKLAVCIVGAARMLVHKDVYGSLERHVLSGNLARGLLKATPDLFVSVHPVDSHHNKPDIPNNIMDVQVADISEVMRILTPVSYIVEEGSWLYPCNASVRNFLPNSSCYVSKYLGNSDILGRTMNYFYSHKSCHELLVKHEEETQQRYDTVMFMRPDIVWLQDAPPRLFSRHTMIFEHDWFQVMPRNTSSYLGNLLYEHFLNENPPVCDARTPEILVNFTGRRAAREQGVRYIWTWDYHDCLKVMRPDGKLFNR